MNIPPDFDFAVATPNDLPEIVALVNSAYRGESADAGWTSEARFFNTPRTTLKDLQHELSGTPASKIFTLREKTSGAMNACMLLQKIDDGSSPPYCYLGMLTVSPLLQDSGLGRLMLEQAEREAREWGTNRLTIRVFSPLADLRAWYERRGFRLTGEKIPFHNPSRLNTPNPEEIHFIGLEKLL